MTKIWTAVAACRGEAQRRLERSGDTASVLPVASKSGVAPALRIPAAVQNLWLRPKAALGLSVSIRG